MAVNEVDVHLLARLLRYTYHTANGDMDAVHDMLHEALTPSMEIHMGTLAEQLIERGVNKGRAEGLQAGRAEGLQAGRAEGLQQGLLAGQRETLARLLTLKFGALSEEMQARLARASHDELVEYTARVLTAETLEAVFG